MKDFRIKEVLLESVFHNICIFYLIILSFNLIFLTCVVDVEFHPNTNFISSATKSEPSDNSASHLFGNGYKTNPVNYSIIYIFKVYDIIFSLNILRNIFWNLSSQLHQNILSGTFSDFPIFKKIFVRKFLRFFLIGLGPGNQILLLFQC